MNGAALQGLLSTVADEAKLVPITVNRARWTATNLNVTAGDTVTWLAWGCAYAARPLAIGVPPHFALGGRVRGGRVQQSARDTYTFDADCDGPVEMASLFPGELRSDGSIAKDRYPYRVMTGGFTAVVARWRRDTDPQRALESIGADDPSGLCAAEASRLANPPRPSSGWIDHPLLRPAETYVPSDRGVAIHVREAVGIVQLPVDVPITETLRIRWSWRIDELPSKLPEDTTLTHDYLSIAVAFDDGRDLTWHWSCSLQEGYSYSCPFDHWRRRETHVVVRTGLTQLGQWIDEERPVLADHRRAIGGSPPARVVGVWMIACNFLQGNEGRGEIGSIELVDGEKIVRAL